MERLFHFDDDRYERWTVPIAIGSDALPGGLRRPKPLARQADTQWKNH